MGCAHRLHENGIEIHKVSYERLKYLDIAYVSPRCPDWPLSPNGCNSFVAPMAAKSLQDVPVRSHQLGTLNVEPLNPGVNNPLDFYCLCQ